MILFKKIKYKNFLSSGNMPVEIDLNKANTTLVVGINGSGKSTLLDLIAHRRLPTGGKIRLGETVSLGYLDQQTNDLISGKGLERKVIDFIEEAASHIDLGKEQITATQLLERFLFPPAQQHSPLKRLSGGEKRRLTLCRILIQAPNVLLLDEPTNDLDIQTLSVLEDFLEDFKGCVVVVSHDRYFLDRTIDRIFSFEKGVINQFEGNYSAFIEKKTLQMQKVDRLAFIKDRKDTETKDSSFQAPSLGFTKTARTTTKTRRRNFKESKELERLDQDLPLLEAKKICLQQTLEQNKGDLVKTSHELAALLEKLRNAEDRWLELSELMP